MKHDDARRNVALKNNPAWCLQPTERVIIALKDSLTNRLQKRIAAATQENRDGEGRSN